MPARETDRAVALWLYICCAAIFAMVVLGGLTRLTGSGLSMVTWQPVTGWLPPLDAAEWEAVFALYRETPEFRRVNFWMTVDDFRSIFWLEYFHRLWGRLIGVVFVVPAVWFALHGRIGRRLGIGLFLAFLLGAGQGALGWYMVQSGLVDRPEVSHYRLAAHLFLALAVYAWLFWLALGLTQERGRQGALAAHIGLVIAGIGLTAIWGAFVAGLDAGHIHPTFPLMDGRLVPPEAFSMAPWAADLTGNPVTVQLVHRWLAMLVLAAILALWWRVRRLPPGERLAFDLLAVTGILQAGLGVATLLLGVPLAAASLHQAGGAVLLSLAIYTLHTSRRAGI